MQSKKLRVETKAGLHARPASMIVKTVNKFKANVKIVKDEKEYDAKSILGILSIASVNGDELTFVAEGEDEIPVLSKVEELFAINFGE